MTSILKSIFAESYEWRATLTITGLLAAGNIIGLILIFGASYIFKLT